MVAVHKRLCRSLQPKCASWSLSSAPDNPDWRLGRTRVSLAQSVGLLIYLWRFPWREPALRADIGSKNFPEKSGVNDDPENRDWHRAGGRMRYPRACAALHCLVRDRQCDRFTGAREIKRPLWV